MLNNVIKLSNHNVISSVPEGADALLFAKIWQQKISENNDVNDVVFIAIDDQRLNALVNALKFYLPTENLLTIPAWDCLPYDRVSPSY
ncbi:MAG: hypothetical protein HRU28_17160, partial [Rhizobiales bacterium]|nr:hypothetical protein [Hyphomicrobiales bacterium]